MEQIVAGAGKSLSANQGEAVLGEGRKIFHVEYSERELFSLSFDHIIIWRQ
jgi:hypothetical protein